MDMKVTIEHLKSNSYLFKPELFNPPLVNNIDLAYDFKICINAVLYLIKCEKYNIIDLSEYKINSSNNLLDRYFKLYSSVIDKLSMSNTNYDDLLLLKKEVRKSIENNNYSYINLEILEKKLEQWTLMINQDNIKKTISTIVAEWWGKQLLPNQNNIMPDKGDNKNPMDYLIALDNNKSKSFISTEQINIGICSIRLFR